MVLMERRLNSRGALIAAWTVVGLLAAGSAGFALFLVWPTVAGGGAGDDTHAARPAVTATALATATTPAGRAVLSGTLERVEGQALLVKVGEGELVRVLVRSGAPVGLVTGTTAGEIQRGEPVVATVSRQSDGRLLATRVRLQPADILTGSPGTEPRPAGSSLEPQTVAGTVVSLDANRLRVRTPRGEQMVELASGARVTRFVPMPFSELRSGQRVTIDGERLVDGSIAALSVQVFESR